MWEIVAGWYGFWQFVFMLGLASIVVSAVARTVTVVVRGWPPPHLDADGDCTDRED